ncbi:MAG: addiction module killer protein [Gammaproteobacteria bacterium CG11_big_fil_rev_8_21_14_0_20_46_22]|nr:MAG: addiction module killer protein [Gammaproteobacteria bacterium CG12_big_fil_rev_8_21_14_0_65_46_12]PIR11386.1 MAG: addiction module killer protein [Gammaproteobacteria bacterium CG11_big_fil_rev_8_21_14_0_20_46_22]
MKTLRLYQAKNGKHPFLVWVESLKDLKAQAQINNRVRRLSLGQRGDYKRVGKGVFELRIHFGPGYRVYFGEHGKEVILLLLGGSKRSQKGDIEQAITYWQDYKERYREKD